jgi:hypothetical protein
MTSSIRKHTTNVTLKLQKKPKIPKEKNEQNIWRGRKHNAKDLQTYEFSQN